MSYSLCGVNSDMDRATILPCLCNIAYTNKYFQFGMKFISTFDVILSSLSYTSTTVYHPANWHSMFWHGPFMLMVKVPDIGSIPIGWSLGWKPDTESYTKHIGT